MKIARLYGILRELIANRGNARSVLAWKLLRPGERRFNYRLDASSIVYDVGGFEGSFADVIRKRFDCTVYVFEPDPTSFSNLKRRFSADRKVILIEGGLAGSEGEAVLAQAGEASRVFEAGIAGGVSIRLISAPDFLHAHNHERIELMKINIEGAEYELMDSLVRSGLHLNVVNFLVQFHAFGNRYRSDYIALVKELNKSHVCEWRFPFLWESWTLRSNPDSSFLVNKRQGET